VASLVEILPWARTTISGSGGTVARDTLFLAVRGSSVAPLPTQKWPSVPNAARVPR